MLPSGGILGLMATAALVASVVMAFKHNGLAGTIVLVVLVICVPTIIVVGFRLLPHTRIGKKLMLTNASKELNVDRGVAGVTDEDYAALVGKTGRTVTLLRPSGIAEIEGQRYSVVSEGEMIAASVEIVVVELHGNSIVVEPKTS